MAKERSKPKTYRFNMGVFQMEKERCKDCIFYTLGESRKFNLDLGKCRRFPRSTKKHKNDYCGEFKKKG